MTRDTRRKIERDVEELAGDDPEDIEMDHVVINFTSADADPDEETVVVRPCGSDGEDREMTIREYENQYGPLDDAEVVAAFGDTQT